MVTGDTSHIEVDLGAIEHNLRVIRGIVSNEGVICAVVKADAYGLGAVRVADRMVSAGVDMLAVYSPSEASELLAAGIDCPVLVLMPLREITRIDPLYRGILSGQLHLALHDERHLEDLLRLADRFGAVLNVHLKIDTGLRRAGCPAVSAPALLRRIAACPRVRLRGVMTHLQSAASDDRATTAQMEVLDDVLASAAGVVPGDCLVHAANSAAMLRDPRHHRSAVRVGLAWAGYAVTMDGGTTRPSTASLLRPCVTWRSRIVQHKRIERGARVGYGAAWTARRPSVLGIVPVGYADGYPPSLAATDHDPRGGFVGVLASGVSGHAPVVGHVSMDQITIDLTDLEVGDRVSDALPGVGTLVEIVSADVEAPNGLERIASTGGVTLHEMLCRMHPRIQRTYRTPIDLPIESTSILAAAG